MLEITFQVEEDLVDGGWVARALGEPIVTQADSIEELKAMIRDALQCHFDNEADVPPVIRLHFVKDEVFNFAV
jgi:predicted RNase H-like HicB family nuclease